MRRSGKIANAERRPAEASRWWTARVNPHDMLNVPAEKALQAHRVNEIQEVYRRMKVRFVLVCEDASHAGLVRADDDHRRVCHGPADEAG